MTIVGVDIHIPSGSENYIFHTLLDTRNCMQERAVV